MQAVLDAIEPGSRVFIAGAAGEPSALLAAWWADPDRTRELSIVTSAIPGINALDLTRLHQTAKVTGFMMQRAVSAEQRARRFRQLPISYNAVQKWLTESPPFDVCVVQVSPPDDRGRYSLGPIAEFFPSVLPRARKTVAIVNARTPWIVGAPYIERRDFVTYAETDTPLPTYEAGPPDAASEQISQLICDHIPDGAALQVGIGKIPTKLLPALSDRRGLRLVTGIYCDGVQRLVEAGALDADHQHRACMAVGTRELYELLTELPLLRLMGCDVTHDISRLAAIDQFIAVNSALEVDLFGQCNLETTAGRAISGVGGAPDFARAAKVSRGGMSIICLPATAQGGEISRIVARLGEPCLVSLPRFDVDLVITEYGVADLRGRSVHERAEALISIAAPRFRSELLTEWRSLAARL